MQDSALEQTLCKKCEQLDIIGCLDRGESKEADITLPDPDADCGLCDALRGLPRHCQAYNDLRWTSSEAELITMPDEEKIFFRVCEEQGKYEDFKFLSFWRPCCSTTAYTLSLHLLTDGHKVSSTTANLALIKRWIEDCHTLHSNEAICTPISTQSSTKLHIIDCDTRKVRQLRQDEPYICLSYVWGQSVVADEQRGLNSTIGTDTPKTIEDAMFVAARLNIPQLWVDQYCVNQHDVNSRTSTIQSMDSIYGGAALTIIAASGSDVYSGIPGIREEKAHTRHAFKVGDQEMIPVEDLHGLIETSQWDTRGWTYQEAILSPRKLVFTDSQILFECGQEYHNVGIYEDFGDLAYSNDWPGQGHFAPMTTPDIADSLYARLEEYFPRKLTFASDGLAAFEGILARFGTYASEHGYAKHFYGIPLFGTADYLPTQTFVNGLAWALANVHTGQAAAPHDQEPGLQFPSWSWASRKAACTSGTARLDTQYCLSGNMEASTEAKVFITRTTHAITLDLADDSTLRALRKETAIAFYPQIIVHTYVLELQLSRQRFKAAEEHSLYGETFLLDEPWQPQFEKQQEHEQVLALYLGSSWEDETLRRTWSDFVFLLVRATNAMKGEYKRMGICEFRAYRDPKYYLTPKHDQDPWSKNSRERLMMKQGREEGTKWRGKRTIRVV